MPTDAGAFGVGALAAALLASACQQESRWVYVPVVPPEVELAVQPSASSAAVGEAVLLHGQRRYRGTWKQVEKASISPEQCWLARPPPEREPEVADNLHWQAVPGSGARFNTGLRSDRAREVVFSEPGTYVLHATSAVWCGPAGGVQAKPFSITIQRAPPKTALKGHP